jgi:hypothetical protein
MALSELQISLIGLGSVGVVAVWAYNKWQERRHRKAAERVFRGDQPDVLLDTQRGPVERGPVDRAPAENKEHIRVEPVMATTDPAPEIALEATITAPPMPFPTSPDPPLEMLDPLIEAVVAFALAAAVPAPRILELQRPLAERLSKPLHWAGLDELGQWCEIDNLDVASYRYLRAGLLLANRAGAIGEAELRDYYQGMEEVAHRLVTTIDLPGTADTLSRANAIDETCANVDIQIAVHVMHREALTVTGVQILEAGQAAGLDFREDGRFYSCGPGSETLFTMSKIGALPFVPAEMAALSTHGLTFWLDVPRVADADVVFDRMMAAAHLVAASLDGVVVDDHRSPLSDAMLLDIRAKIVEIQQGMSAQGITPGGARALRLFS